jgi:transposase
LKYVFWHQKGLLCRRNGTRLKRLSRSCGPEKYPWLTKLLARKPFKVVAVALANKMARIAWALLVKGGPYRARALVAAA